MHTIDNPKYGFCYYYTTLPNETPISFILCEVFSGKYKWDYESESKIRAVACLLSKADYSS